MSDQLLPDFDGSAQPVAQPAPKKPRRKPAKKIAKRTKRERAMVAIAKRVPKKRRVKHTVASTFRLPLQSATRPNEPLLTSKEFDVTLQVFRILGEFDPQIRKRMLARLQGAL